MVQERSSLLIEAVRRHFLGEGYSEEEPPAGFDAAFRKGGELVGVKVFTFSSNPVRDRRALRSLLYRILRERACDLAYVVVDEVRYSHLPSSAEFEESCVGLLKVGEGGVEVAVRAKPLRGAGRALEAPAAGASAVPLEGARIEALERRIEALEALLQRLESALQKLSPERAPPLEPTAGGGAVTGGGGRAAPQAQAPPAPVGVGGELAVLDLPFIRDNPWIRSLASRAGERASSD